MGQKELKQKQTIGQQWQLYTQTSQVIKSINPYSNRVLMNINTKQLIEEYQLHFTSEHDLINYRNQLQYRKVNGDKQMIGISYKIEKSNLKNCKFLYKIMEFFNVTEEDVCSNLWKGLLYMDKVDVRLTQINDIPFEDELYLVEGCLEGFKVLYEQVGYFDIIQDMIFITKKGQVKVWLHPNLAKNQPYYISKNLQLYNCSQSLMIVNLLNIIQNNIDKTSNNNNIHFKEYLTKKNILERLSFYKALQQFKRYCDQNNLHYRGYIRSVYQLYHGDLPLPIQRSTVYKIGGQSQVNQRKVGDVVRSREKRNKFSISIETPHAKDKRQFFNESLPTPKSSNHSNTPRIIKNSLKKQERHYGQINGQLLRRSSSVKQQSQTPINNLSPYNNIWDKVQLNEFSFGKQQKKDFNLLSNSLITDQRYPITKTTGLVPPRINYVRKMQRQQTNSHRMLSITPEVPSIRSQKINNIENIKFMNSKASFSTFSLNPTQSHPQLQKIIKYHPRDINGLKNNNSLKYFAVNQNFILDAEIARDIHKQFGVNPYDL